MKMDRVTFLSSGNGGNVKFLHLLKNDLKMSNFTLSVIADRECGATDFARRSGIDCRVVSVDEGDQFYLSKAIAEVEPSLIFTTIHKVIAPEVLNLYSDLMINLHYSLLPKYSGVIGMKGVELAIKNNDDYLGVTTHRVTSDLDGGPIITQSYFQNPQDFFSASNVSFRIGCLQILACVQQREILDLSLSSISENIMENVSVHHSRKIPIFPSFVNSTFWSQLSTL